MLSPDFNGGAPPFARDEMSKEEDYAFDVAGYLCIPAVLGGEELRAVDAAAGAPTTSLLLEPAIRELLVNPTATWYLNRLVGAGFRLDTEPELLAEASGPQPLSGGAVPREPKNAYYWSRLGRRQCNSVRVIYALDDVGEGDGGFCLIPQSHQVNVACPEAVRNGDSLKGLGEGIIFQPSMRAGDMLVVAGACLQGMQPWRGSRPQRLLSFRFVGRSIVSEMGPNELPDPMADETWWQSLTEAQRISLGRGGGSGPATIPSPTIVTDGGDTVSLDESGAVQHPSIYKRDEESGIDEAEFFHFELCGFLVLRNVMDPEWLRAANEAVDLHEDRIAPSSKPLGQAGGVAATRTDEWAGRPTLGGLLQLPEPHAEPFRKMIAHPAVQHRLNWMGGSGLRGGNGSVFATVEGGIGHSLHDGAGGWPHMGYEFTADGRSFASAITVTWQLRDVLPGMGGFVRPGNPHVSAQALTAQPFAGLRPGLAPQPLEPPGGRPQCRRAHESRRPACDERRRRHLLHRVRPIPNFSAHTRTG